MTPYNLEAAKKMGKQLCREMRDIVDPDVMLSDGRTAVAVGLGFDDYHAMRMAMLAGTPSREWDDARAIAFMVECIVMTLAEAEEALGRLHVRFDRVFGRVDGRLQEARDNDEELDVFRFGGHGGHGGHGGAVATTTANTAAATPEIMQVAPPADGRFVPPACDDGRGTDRPGDVVVAPARPHALAVAKLLRPAFAPLASSPVGAEPPTLGGRKRLSIPAFARS